MGESQIPYSVVARKEAKASGAKRYFTGKPCPHGHFAERYTSTSNCAECQLVNFDIWKQHEGSSAIVNALHIKYRQANHLKVRGWDKEKMRRRKDRDPEFVLAEGRKRNARHRKAHPEFWRQKGLKDYWSDPQAAVDRSKAYARANPDKVNANCNRRRARKNAAEGSYTESDILRLFAEQNGRCAALWCAIEMGTKYTVDHIQPLTRGGSNWPSNLQLLCKSCNSSKRNKTMAEWQPAALAVLALRS